MAGLARSRHGNKPQRRATLLPRVSHSQHSITKQRSGLALEAQSAETGPNLATTVGEQVTTDQPYEMEIMQLWSWQRTADMASMYTQHENQMHFTSPVNKESLAASLRRIGIHPETQRILGNSCVAVVSLERLRIPTAPGQFKHARKLEPRVPVMSPPCLPQLNNEDDDSVGLACCQQVHMPDKEKHGSNQNMIVDGEITVSSKTEPTGSFGQGESQTLATYWTETNLQDRTMLETEPLPDSESNSLQFESECDPSFKTDSLESKSESAQFPVLIPKWDSELDLRSVCEEDGEAQRQHLEPCQEPVASNIPETGDGRTNLESEDFCAVCLNGGDLLCCDRCPKVYHLACHIPPLMSFPLGDWACTLCRTEQDPEVDSETLHPSTGTKTPYTLSTQYQRRCEKLTLLLSCHNLSGPFHEPVSPLAHNYYQIIKRPIDISVIRRKLNKRNTLHYFTAEQFVDDVLLMFKNCATFNYPDSEVAQAGQSLEVFFLTKLREVFPDHVFPTASQDKMERARLSWQNRKRKENYNGKKKSHIINRKRYYL